MINPAIIKAVIAALHMNNAAVYACYETGSGIVELPSGELKSVAAEVKETTGHSVTFYLALPRTWKLVAIWHTHPQCEPGIDDRRFSDGDIAMQHRLKVPSFIYVQADMSVRMYDGKRETVIATGFQP